MRYRFLQNWLRWRKGAVIDLPPSAMKEWCRSEGMVLEETVTPDDLGQSWMEKPPIILRDIDLDERRPTPGGETASDLDELSKQLKTAQRRLADQQGRLRELVSERDEISGRLALIGCSEEERDRILSLHKAIDKTQRLIFQSEGEILALEKTLNREPVAGGLEDERLDELRKLALVLAQFDDLLDLVTLTPYHRWSGQVKWNFGPDASQYATEFKDLVEQIGNGIPPVIEDDIIEEEEEHTALKTISEILENGTRIERVESGNGRPEPAPYQEPEVPRIVEEFDQLMRKPEWRALVEWSQEVVDALPPDERELSEEEMTEVQQELAELQEVA